MIKVLDSIKRGLTLFLSIVLLIGCGVQDLLNGDSVDENSNALSDHITSISDLRDTTYFRNGALEHILEGEINNRGDAVGFHYDGLPTKKGKVIQGTETEPNEFDVYEAKVEVSGTFKTWNGGKSTFFPKEWSPQQVVDAINEAYEVKTFISGNVYEGLATDGMVIRMYLDQKDKIISAFPVY